MPLPVAHSLVGAAFVAAAHPEPLRRRLAPLALGALLANCADFDFALVFLTRERSYHRGFTHSLLFALAVCAALLACFGLRRAREALAYGLAYASHAPLDFATTRLGGGLELFWPFSSERLGLRLFGLSELPRTLPPAEVLKAAALELLIFAPPLLLALALRRRPKGRGGP